MKYNPTNLERLIAAIKNADSRRTVQNIAKSTRKESSGRK